MKFAQSVEAFKNKALEDANKFKQAVGIELFSSVILDTPVDTGRARGNWQISLNAPMHGVVNRTESESLIPVKNPNKYGGLLDDNYLTNNLPYIVKLELGSSKQAPAGMVRKNVARIEQILQAQLKKVKK